MFAFLPFLFMYTIHTLDNLHDFVLVLYVSGFWCNSVRVSETTRHQLERHGNNLRDGADAGAGGGVMSRRHP